MLIIELENLEDNVYWLLCTKHQWKYNLEVVVVTEFYCNWCLLNWNFRTVIQIKLSPAAVSINKLTIINKI